MILSKHTLRPWNLFIKKPTGHLLSNWHCRSLHGLKLEADEKTFLPEALGNTRSFGMNSTVDSTWHLTSQVPASPVPESRNDALLQNYPQLRTLQDFEPLTVDDAPSKQQEEQYLFGREFSSSGSMRQENQSLQPLFDEWPKCRDMDSYFTDQRSNKSSSGVQLSMAIPMAPNSAPRSYHSPNGKCVSLWNVLSTTSHPRRPKT